MVNDSQVQKDAILYDALVAEHLKALNSPYCIVGAEGEWEKEGDYQYRWFRVRDEITGIRRRCYRVNEDQTVERLG